MKLHTLLIAFFAFALVPAHAQSLSENPPTKAALEVIEMEKDFKTTIDFLEAKLRSTHRKMTAGSAADIQARLDEMGTKAAANFAQYKTIYDLIKSVRPDSTVPAPDPAVFVVNLQTGKVTYVAPPEPEPPTPPAP